MLTGRAEVRAGERVESVVIFDRPAVIAVEGDDVFLDGARDLDVAVHGNHCAVDVR